MENTDGFVGREAELGLLQRALDEARRGHGSLVIVEGEPGVGKTRLARRFADDMKGLAIWSHCWTLSEVPAFWAFRELFAGLDAILPEARSRFGFEEESLSDAKVGPDERYAMFQRVWTLLRSLPNLPNASPLLWIVDDLHAADLASLELLEFVATRIHEAPILVLATYRSVGRATHEDAERRLAAVSRGAAWLPLSGLPIESVSEFVQQRSGQRPSPSLAATLLDATKGNPLFLEGITRAAGSAGRSLSGSARYEVAPGISAAIEQRLSLAGAAVREALQAASVLGTSFESKMVAEVAGMDAALTLDALTRAEREGLIDAQDHAGLHLRFAHQLTQEVVYEGLSRPQRRHLHRAAIAVIEAQGAEPSEELLRHHLAIGAPDGPAFEIACSLAKRDRQLLAYEAAVRRYRTALSLAPESKRGRVLVSLGDAELLAGQARDAREHIREALILARQRNDVSAIAEAALALTRTVEFGAPDMESLDALEEALRRVSPGKTRVRVALRLAEEMWIDESQVERRAKLSAEALAQAREFDDPQLLAHALGARMRSTWSAANTAARADLSAQLAEVALRTDSLSLHLEAERWRSNSTWELGQASEGDSALRRYVRVSDQLASPHARTNAYLRRIMAAEISGQLDEIKHLRDSLIEAAREANHPQVGIYKTMASLLVDVERGDAAATETLLPEYMQVSRRLRLIPAGWALPAYVHFRANDPEGARMHLVDAMERGVPTAYGDSAALCMLAQVAAACDCSDDLVQRLYRQLLPFRHFFAVAGLGVCYGSCERYLGQLALCSGNLAQASEHFEAAITNNRKAGSRGFCAHSLCELAQVLRRSGIEGSRPNELESEALRYARSLGFTALEKRLVDTEPPIVSSDEQIVLTRDGDGWRVSRRDRHFHLKDRRGLSYLAQLLAQPGVAFPALSLASANHRENSGKVAVQGGIQALDSQARREYQSRVAELRQSEADARERGHSNVVEGARIEREFLEEELMRATGLGNRMRKGGGHAERARVSVTNALRRAIAAIGERAPDLAANLKVTVRTGAMPMYDSTASPGIRWDVEGGADYQ